MRTRLVLAAVICVFLVSRADVGRAQTVAGTPAFFNATPLGARVTLSRNGSLTGSFVFPKGTQLMVVGARQEASYLGSFAFKYNGPFEVRVLPSDDVARPNLATADQFGRAPIVLTGSAGLSVLIENVP